VLTPSPASRVSENAGAPPARLLFLFFAVELLLILALQLPAVADFQKFAFYDEGAWLHLDKLVAGGAVPTVDFGYSYGMLPVIASRGWFGLFGRSPWTFIACVTACNLLTAWGIASILSATGASWRRLWTACALLPLAIFPNAYSLMHPMEMALIVWALERQSRERYGMALALATLAVLTKPSMAYVLGLLLLLLAAWLKKGWRVVIPPAIAGIAGIAASILFVGARPALANIIPVTGADSYTRMNFGIFHAGMDFWWHTGSLPDVLQYYLFSPALFWIAASLWLWGMGGLALLRLWNMRHKTPARQEGPRPADPLVLTIAVLHAAFVFAFYAWSGSWTYYAYLPVIGLLVGVRGPRQRRVLNLFVMLALLGYYGMFNNGISRWRGMVRSSDTAGLWAYPDVLAQARAVRQLVNQHHGIYLVNGALPLLWPEAKTPPSWFLSPGIPNQTEFDRARQLVRSADVVVLCMDYSRYSKGQDVWFWPEFKHERAQFEPPVHDLILWKYQEKPLLENEHFLVLSRKQTP
jgi:hypothetical protein